MELKICTKCKVGKDQSCFYMKNKAKPEIGFAAQCKPCRVLINSEWNRNDPNRNAYTRAWRKANPLSEQASKKKWNDAHKHVNKASSALWAANNPAKTNAKAARYRAAKLKATPVWANDFYIEEIYDIAQRRSKIFGFEWHVDHIVPLNSKKVCGLHCEANLRVIPGPENRSKSNRYWPQMP